MRVAGPLRWYIFVLSQVYATRYFRLFFIHPYIKNPPMIQPCIAVKGFERFCGRRGCLGKIIWGQGFTFMQSLSNILPKKPFAHHLVVSNALPEKWCKMNLLFSFSIGLFQFYWLSHKYWHDMVHCGVVYQIKGIIWNSIFIFKKICNFNYHDSLNLVLCCRFHCQLCKAYFV